MPRWRAYRTLEWFIFVGLTVATFAGLVGAVMLLFAAKGKVQVVTYRVPQRGEAIPPPAAADARGFRITSPTTGAVVMAGQVISVSVDPGVHRLAEGPLVDISGDRFATTKVDEKPPYSVDIEVPLTLIGPQLLRAVARDDSMGLLETSTLIIVEAPSPLQDIAVPEEMVLFWDWDRASAGDPKFRTERLRVSGIYADEVIRDLTENPETQYQAVNLKIATIDAAGWVLPAAPGRTTIRVSYRGFLKEVPVAVGISELEGDLDNDLDVDRDDLEILKRAEGAPATGPDDPRDVNHDQTIDTADFNLLRTLCSRAQCKTQTG